MISVPSLRFVIVAAVCLAVDGAVVGAFGPLAAQVDPKIAIDRVVFREALDQPTRTLKGTIVEFDRRSLRLKQVKKERSIPTDQIVEVHTRTLPEVLDARRLLHEHDYRAAAKILRDAHQREVRPWVRNEITAQLVECYRESGLWMEATETFERLLADDPQTRFLNQLPITWQPVEPDVIRDETMAGWLSKAMLSAELNRANDKSSESLAANLKPLVAASVFLNHSQHRTGAIRVLTRLAGSDDTTLSSLAKMQLWRTRAARATLTDLKRWEAELDHFPQQLRYGGHVVLGSIYARLALEAAGKEISNNAVPDDEAPNDDASNNEGSTDDPSAADLRTSAALQFARVPINQPEHFQLSAFCLVAAARVYEKTPPELLSAADEQTKQRLLALLKTKFKNSELGRAIR